MKSNSGLRLLNVLDQLKAASANELTAKVVKKIFNDEDDSHVGIHIGQIFTLANTVHKQTVSLPDFEPEVDLRWMQGVYTGLSALSVKGNINAFKDAYKPEVRAYLECCSRNLSKFCPDPIINSESLNTIYNEISTLIDLLNDDKNIDQILKNFISDKLLIIQDVIANANIVGFSELSSNVETVFAGTIFRSGGIDRVQEIRKSSDAFARFIDWLGRILILLETAELGYKGIGFASQLLLG